MNGVERMTDSEQLEAIRKKFVGSGVEHELLRRVCDDYQKAYDKGWNDRDKQIVEQSTADADTVRYARALVELNYEARRFISFDEYHDPTDSYSLPQTARWLMGVGRTPEQLRKLADAMEQIKTEAPQEAAQ